jgi:methylated-DNA-[protein]-cysteine S-methyltransferase
MLCWSRVEPIAGLTAHILVSSAGLRRLELSPEGEPGCARDDSHPLAAEAARQLRAYFAGELRSFTLPLDAQGTEFYQRVWRLLVSIPYGETRSYRWLAEAAGSPRGFRAVGQANARNPIAIIVPCHRVIAADKSLGGYAYGLGMKRRLLDLEAGGGLTAHSDQFARLHAIQRFHDLGQQKPQLLNAVGFRKHKKYPNAASAKILLKL